MADEQIRRITFAGTRLMSGEFIATSQARSHELESLKAENQRLRKALKLCAAALLTEINLDAAYRAACAALGVKSMLSSDEEAVEEAKRWLRQPK
jgi:hypothetical protein